MAERRGGLGRGLGELFQRTDLDARVHPVDEHVIVGNGAEHQDIDQTATGEAFSSSTAATAKEEGRAGTKGDVSRETSLEATTGETPEGAGTPAEGADEPAVDSANGVFADVPVEAIVPNAKQPRTVFDEDALDELVESIKEVGLLQPIVVRDVGAGQFELIMGERRWRAAQQAGMATIPAIIRQTDDTDMLRDALLENIHRVQLNPLEEAAAYQQMIEDFACTQAELAERIKRSRSQIANTLRLLNLPGTVQRRVAAGVLSAGHARALLGLSDALAQEQVAQRIVAEGLSVRATEELVALGGVEAERPRARRTRPQDPALLEYSHELGNLLDTRVEVSQGAKKGKIIVEYASRTDLERIMGLLRG